MTKRLIGKIIAKYLLGNVDSVHDEGGRPKILENGSITETLKSQNGSITETQICPKRPFSRNFRGAFGAATDFEL